ncbi:MAG: DUF2079 domain-containing protein [Deltaproteobacteria bacterium]|nr:DUF2079 domain-containing protein [Deltaproteobacteria bacterium]
MTEPAHEEPQLARFASAGLAIASSAALASFGARVLLRRLDTASLGSLAELPRFSSPRVAVAAPAIAAAMVLLSISMRPALRSVRVTTALAGVALFGIAGSFLLHQGRFAIITSIAVLSAVTLASYVPRRVLRLEASDRTLAVLAFAIVSITGLVFALHRYSAYGAGSWDHGCMVHNFFRAAYGLDSLSTVLGGVDFLGDHFMVGIYLYAPFVWIHSGGETVLAIQTLNLAAVAPAIFLVARHRGARKAPAFALALAAGLSFGNQSAMYFDSHEITVGFGFLALAVWAIETDRLRLAAIALAIFATFKESLGAYVVGLGLLLVVRGALARDARRWRFGLALIAAGAAWFVLVNRVFMPALIARGQPPEPHETFADFGPTVFSALVGMVESPVRAIASSFIPSAKVASQLVTIVGTGGLCLLSPSIAIAALPLVAERFLSSKSTMWEMGYHYGASLCFYAAWAAALALPRAERVLVLAADTLRAPRTSRTSLVLALHILASMLLVNEAGYHHAANFHRWNMEYFSTPERRVAHRGAIELLRSRPRSEAIAAQNRILPHLADRPEIYRLQDHSRATHVIVSIGENAWPFDDGYPARLVRELSRTHRLTYSAVGTAVLTRCPDPNEAPCKDLPAASPSSPVAPLLLR